MHDPFEGLVALARPRPLVAEDFDLPASCAEAHRPLRQYFASPRARRRHVVVMPGTAPLAPVRILDLIGPVRDFAQRMPVGGLIVGHSVASSSFVICARVATVRNRSAISPTMLWPSGPHARALGDSQSASRPQRTREFSKRL